MSQAVIIAAASALLLGCTPQSGEDQADLDSTAEAEANGQTAGPEAEGDDAIPELRATTQLIPRRTPTT